MGPPKTPILPAAQSCSLNRPPRRGYDKGTWCPFDGVGRSAARRWNSDVDATERYLVTRTGQHRSRGLRSRRRACARFCSTIGKRNKNRGYRTPYGGAPPLFQPVHLCDSKLPDLIRCNAAVILRQFRRIRNSTADIFRKTKRFSFTTEAVSISRKGTRSDAACNSASNPARVQA